MPERSLRLAVIVLEVRSHTNILFSCTNMGGSPKLTSMTLITILLATPAQKHPIVNTLLLATILRSLFNALPSLVYEAAPQSMSNDTLQHTGLGQFCIADAIMYVDLFARSIYLLIRAFSLRFFTVVQAALGISFTLVRCADSKHVTFYSDSS